MRKYVNDDGSLNALSSVTPQSLFINVSPILFTSLNPPSLTAVTVPFFLVFSSFDLLTTNLLLQYLSKIKVLQLERDRGEWEGLAPDARREKESSLQMLGQLGRFHNIMSNETIGTLAFLTSGQTRQSFRLYER